MNQLVDFSYYKTSYQGNLIPNEVAFIPLSVKASAIVGNYTMDRVFLPEFKNNDKVKLCICELSELEYLARAQLHGNADGSGKSVASEHVGDYSVSYKDSIDLSNDTVIKRKRKDIIETYLSGLGLTYRVGYVL